ncbi:MAG TPA: exodeoxyribonuclease V subunit gamma [Desulfobacterales bacterium]|nr:exodeoxyribonuclease V subunit gamma [Desulfobacterales bacterium]HIP39408.1 exodeoxyribonuclease V subunit gamma [Desulfocapsa sulfexigens]
MFYLHLSNRTENLIRQLSEVLSLAEDRDPFSPEYFLIQSQGMERMLSQQLSERFVSWCNYEYMLPTRFFALMAERLGMEPGSDDYAREKVCWHLENILRRVDGKRFAMIRRYIDSDSNGMKRYQLAGQLAAVFDQYQIMRPQMIDGWEQGRTGTNNSAEYYQMELWNLLRDSIGHSRHRGVFLRDLIKLLTDNREFLPVLPERLSVFGLHSLPPLLLSCLQALSNHCDVHFYLLSPCETYWSEQVTPRAQLRKNIVSHGHGKDVAETTYEGHPLLASLGQQGREFQAMLQDARFSGEFQSFVDPFDDASPYLLHKLQSDLLKGELSSGEGSLSADESLTVVSTHSAHREVMILKDRILSWLDNDPDLALKDIVVMAPDIQDYSGLIPAVFHDIPHSIADRNPALSNRFIGVFLQFLDLCTSRFGWSEVLDLLEREEVYPRFDIREKDLELIRHWVVSSGIRWGLSGEQKQDMGLPGKEECTWRSGLDSLMMGYAVGCDCEIDGILPYRDIEGSMAEPLGGLSLFCEILEQAHEAVATPHTLAEWDEMLAEFAEKLFVADGDNSLLELYGMLTDLGQEYGTVHHEKIHFDVVCSWVEGMATEQKSSSGFLRGQLTFCSMLPMRSIPFQKVCLLGLNDTVFPKNDYHPPFDLLTDRFLPGDRSRRSDDRYQFLEAILSARKALYLSYVGQSIRSNDKMPPSVVISEMLEVLEFYGISELREYHPLQGFSGKYFTIESSLFSYNNKLFDVYRSLQRDACSSDPWWQGNLDKENQENVDVADLFRFFQNPQRFFVQNVLGIRLNNSVSSLEEQELFILDPLQKYLVEQDFVSGRLSGREWNELYQRVRSEGQWMLGTPGEIYIEKKQEELQSFIDQVMIREKTEHFEDRFVDLQIGSIRLTGKLGSMYLGGSFLFRYAKMKARDIVTAWVQHCLTAVCCDTEKDTTLLTKDCELFFPAGTAKKGDLQELLSLFLQGQQAPSMLLPEPVLAYAREREKFEETGKGDPLFKAKQSFSRSLEQGYEPEWELLYQYQTYDNLFGQEFLETANWFYDSIWRRADVRKL